MVKVVPDEVVKGIDKYMDWKKYVELRKSDNKILFVDTNIGLDHALGLARQGYEVFFAVVHGSAFPKIEDEINGYGFDEIRKVWDWGEGLEEGAGVVVFADSGFGALADWLRSKGYAVFGSDSTTERIELDRVFFKKVVKRLGIKTPKYEVVKGIDGVVSGIKKYGKRFVKVSRFRGDVETFGTDDPEEAEIILRRSDLGMFDDVLEFVLEEPMDKDKFVEIGVDAFFNGERFLDTVFDTVELKWTGNFTTVNRIEDSPWYEVLKRFELWLAKNGYRGMFALEGFWDGEDVYVTDPTPRWPYVCSYAYPRLIKNYAEVVIGVAQGEDVKIETKTKYSVQIPMYTDEPDKWIEVKSKDWDMVAHRHSVKVEGRVFWVPVEDNVVVTGIGLGDRIDDAILNAIKVVEGVEASSTYHRAYEFKHYFGQRVVKLEELGYPL